MIATGKRFSLDVWPLQRNARRVLSPPLSRRSQATAAGHMLNPMTPLGMTLGAGRGGLLLVVPGRCGLWVDP